MSLDTLREVAERRETAHQAAIRAKDREDHRRHAIAAAKHAGELFDGIVEYLADLERREGSEARTAAARIVAGVSATKKTSRTDEPRSFRSLFGEPRGAGGFASFNEMLDTLASGLGDPRLSELRTMAGSAGSTGGYLVPDEFAREIWDVAFEESFVLRRCRILPMRSDSLKVAAWDGLTHSTNLYGGFAIAGEWLGEGATGTRSTPLLRQLEFIAKKASLFVAASSEVVDDGIDFETQLSAAMRRALGWIVDHHVILTGTGAGEPLSFLNDPAKIAVTSSAGANTLAGDDLAAMWARLHPGCVRNSIWLMSSEAYGYALTLKNGDGGYLFAPDVTATGFNTLYGRPVVISEHCSQVGTEGDVFLVDPTQYGLALRKEITLERTNAAQWLQDLVDYRASIRLDGMGGWSSAVTPANGGDTLSWVVTIGTRS